MKTIIICSSKPGKSIPNYFFALGNGFQELGYRVIMVVDNSKKAEVIINGLSSYAWPNDRPTGFKDALFFYRLCRKYNPDVVISQFSSSIIALTVSWFLGVKNRINYRHTMLSQIGHRFEHLSFRLRSKWHQFMLHNLATHVFTNSAEAKDELVKRYAISETKINVFHYLTSDINKDKTILEFSERKFQVAFVGRLHRSKGHATVFRQIPEVVKKFPALKFVIAGTGAEETALKSLCLELGITNAVEFLGFIQPSEVGKLMQESIVHMSASKAEAFSLVNAEALGCGTPILGPFISGIKEIVDDGVNGFFYSPDQSGDLLNKIEKILDQWEVLSVGARESFLNKFSVDNGMALQTQITHMSTLFYA